MDPKVQGPQCLQDEELFAGICYMKCSLLTAGKAPHRVGNNACCRNDNDFFCTLLGSQQAVSAGLAVGGGEAVHNQPHAPGVGGLCTQEEEAYQGLCYPKCSDLTNGQSPYRVGSFQCCHGSALDCLHGKGTISSTPNYGTSEIPAAKDHGRSYKALNIIDAKCNEDEDDYNGLCYEKCSRLTYGQGTIRTGPSSCCTCGKGFFQNLCCGLPWNGLSDASFAVGQSEAGQVTDPHPPGMRIRCSSDEELFEGICYSKCATLTGGKMPHRITSAVCCKFDSASACQSPENAVISVNLDRSREISNALPHAPYMRPETD